MTAAGATTPGDDDFEAGPMQAWFTQLVKATQGIKQGTPTRGPRKPPVPPKPKITPSAKKETQVHVPGEQRGVGARVALFRHDRCRAVGYPQRTCGIHQESGHARDSQKNDGRCQKESRKFGQESLGLEILENPVKWDGLVDAVLRPVPDRGVDDARNVAASYLMYKTSSTRQALNFIGPVISTWVLVPI